MYTVVNKTRLLIFCVISAVVLVIFLVLHSLSDHRNMQHAMKQVDGYEIRNELLMDAIREVGVKSDEDAVRLWARGVKLRNGAMQAAVMDSALQKTYLLLLDQRYPDWVTAFSSPWVADYQIEKQNGTERLYRVCFITESASGYDHSYQAQLTLVDENGFPRISAIEMDEGLKAYTGF